MEPLHLFLLDQGFPVEYELDEFNTPHTRTTLRHPKIGYVDSNAKFRSDTLLLLHWATFSGDIHASPRNNQNHKLTVTTSFLSSNSNTTVATPMANISSSHIQQCLNLTMHFSLRHLAAKMLSQLYHNFISFPYLFPSYETCSINVNSLFHAAIKKLHIKPNSTCFWLFHLSHMQIMLFFRVFF